MLVGEMEEGHREMGEIAQVDEEQEVAHHRDDEDGGGRRNHDVVGGVWHDVVV